VQDEQQKDEQQELVVRSVKTITNNPLGLSQVSPAYARQGVSRKLISRTIGRCLAVFQIL